MTEGRRQGTLVHDGYTGRDAVFAFLADPATHSLSEPIKRIDTHAAAVFLAGKDVYEVKKAIRFSFMDRSTLARRQMASVFSLARKRGGKSSPVIASF